MSARGLLGLLTLLVACSAPEAPRRIYLIVVDTLRADHLSSYGAETPTPHLDALATRGQRFPHAYSSFHQTTMSMGALFTGRTPSLEGPGGTLKWNGRTWCGLGRLADRAGEHGCIPADVPTLTERLRDAGYWTAAVVTNPLLFAASGFERGFAAWEELQDANAPCIGSARRSPTASEVNQRALELLATRTSERVFLYVHYMDVHDYRLWDRSYAEMVQQVDQAVGDLIAGLERNGLLEDAMIVFTADHGERLGEPHLVSGRPGHRGNPSFDQVLHVPLLVAPAQSASVERLMRSTDTFHLLLELAGLQDRVPLELDSEELFTSEMHWQTYRSGRWKSYRARRSDQIYLVDLEHDPAERADVAPQFPDVVAEHRARLDQLAQRLRAAERDVTDLTAEDRRRLEALGYLP